MWSQGRTVFQVEVVVLAKDVGRDDRREVAAVLRVVHAVLHIHEAFGVRIALRMRARLRRMAALAGAPCSELAHACLQAVRLPRLLPALTVLTKF